MDQRQDVETEMENGIKARSKETVDEDSQVRRPLANKI